MEVRHGKGAAEPSSNSDLQAASFQTAGLQVADLQEKSLQKAQNAGPESVPLGGSCRFTGSARVKSMGGNVYVAAVLYRDLGI